MNKLDFESNEEVPWLPKSPEETVGYIHREMERLEIVELSTSDGLLRVPLSEIESLDTVDWVTLKGGFTRPLYNYSEIKAKYEDFLKDKRKEGVSDDS